MDKILHALTTKKYSDGITLITPTGDRHVCMERCEFYIKRQTYTGPLQWIIADDGIEHFSPGMGQLHLKHKPWSNKVKSFTENIISILLHIEFNKVLIIEDDDWYDRKYIDIYRQRLDNYQLVGEGPARYYHVPTQTYRHLANRHRASFCQTGLRAEILDRLYVSALKQTAFVDARLWSKDCKKFVFQDKIHCIGMKGLPGRKGIGIGHRPSKAFHNDLNWKVLAKWIGFEDIQFYRGFSQKCES